MVDFHAIIRDSDKKYQNSYLRVHNDFYRLDDEEIALQLMKLSDAVINEGGTSLYVSSRSFTVISKNYE